MRVGRFIGSVDPFIALSLILAAPTARSQTANPVEARATPTHYTGPCPGLIRFKSRIVANDRTTVTYRWERSDGETGPVKSIRVGAGGAIVTEAWRLGTAGKVIHGSERLRVLSPGDAYSGEASFTMACGGASSGPYHPVRLPSD